MKNWMMEVGDESDLSAPVCTVCGCDGNFSTRPAVHMFTKTRCMMHQGRGVADLHAGGPSACSHARTVHKLVHMYFLIFGERNVTYLLITDTVQMKQLKRYV